MPASPGHISPKGGAVKEMASDATKLAASKLEDEYESVRCAAIESLRQRMLAIAGDDNAPFAAKEAARNAIAFSARRPSGGHLSSAGGPLAAAGARRDEPTSPCTASQAPQDTDAALPARGPGLGLDEGQASRGHSFQSLKEAVSFQSFRLQGSKSWAEAQSQQLDEGSGDTATLMPKDTSAKPVSGWEAAFGEAQLQVVRMAEQAAFSEAQRRVAQMAERAQREGWQPEEAQRQVARMAEQAHPEEAKNLMSRGNTTLPGVPLGNSPLARFLGAGDAGGAGGA